MNMCYYCNEREGIYQFKNGRWCCQPVYNSCPKKREERSGEKSHRWGNPTGWSNPNPGRHFGDKNPAKRPEVRKKLSDNMLNGGAKKALAGNKSPSKPQVKLFELVLQLCNCAEIEYKLKKIRKRIDIAIPFHKIAIDYYGNHWHEGREEYDENRKNEIESLGWKTLIYKEHIPSLEELKQDIERIGYER